MDNQSAIDAGTTVTPRFGNLFAPCLTCADPGQQQGAQSFPHTVHKIRHTLWTTAHTSGPGGPSGAGRLS
ncbi:hypothetical protein GCM10023336_14160 [Streptomyces similanensis]|uniref:Uncharacterized protein n=1 Tax=Streptomyces similanensis TaxID=1274988 RepID=A0ABP9K2E6_9ACTN